MPGTVPPRPGTLGRLRAEAAARPGTTDAVIALALYATLTVAITSAAEADHRDGAMIGALLNVAIVGPLAFRRRAPFGSLAAALTASVIVTLGFGPTGAEAAVLLALGTGASREPDFRRTAGAGGAVLAALVLGTVTAGTGDALGTLAAGVAGITAAIAVGVAASARSTQRAAEADRAARLERDRRQEAELAIVAERTRIARELHDIVAHHVSIMVALADGAQQIADTEAEQAGQAMGQVASVGREALTELRGLLGVLRDSRATGPTRKPQPSVEELGALVERVRDAGVPTVLRTHGAPSQAGAVAQVTIYRIVQEALTNTLRHGRSVTKAEVSLRWEPDAVEIEVLDNGNASPPGATRSEGRGIAGMRERAGVHDAILTAGPSPAGGWRVAVRLPLRDGSGTRT
jgi:signal transduction histidine kinase